MLVTLCTTIKVTPLVTSQVFAASVRRVTAETEIEVEVTELRIE